MTLFLTARERHALRRVLPLVGLDRRGFALSVLLGVCGLGAAIALGATSAWLIAFASQHPPVLHLTVAAVSVRLFGISRALMRYLGRLASHRVALDGMDALRRNLYDALRTTGVDRLAALQRGDLLARTGADVDDVGDLVVKTLLPACVTTIVGVGTVAGIALVSPVAGLVLAICLLLSGVITPLLVMNSVRMAEADQRRARTDIAITSLTLLEGASELQVSGRVEALHARLAQAERDLITATARSARMAGLAAGIDRLAMGLAVIAALLIGIPATTSGALAAVMLAVIVLTPLASFEGTAELAPAAVQLVRSAAAAVRISDLIGEETPRAGLPLPEGTRPLLEARDLAVGWSDDAVLANDLTLTVAPGRCIGVVGPSGIGKTTLLLTLAGMIPPRGGRLTIDGNEVWGADRADLTALVNMTAEDAHVFATSVLENLRVSSPGLTPERARELLGAVGLGDWLDRLPDGLDTLIGSGATTVSGGERRRLLMARALASPAPLMLLDEAAEHLDPASADHLLDVLTRAVREEGRGLLLVTHRLSALEHLDEVIVLGRDDSGCAHVLARGPHDHLIRTLPAYRWAREQEDQ